MKIADQVKSLNLPLGSYTVISSGSLEAHGIRPAKGIDLQVTKELYEQLKNQGWKEKVVDPKVDFKILQKDNFEAGYEMIVFKDPKVNWKPDPQEVINDSDIIDGVAFMNLHDLRNFKLAMNREKDFEDIKLIDQHLSTN